jgi:hypothetical protein
MRGDDINIDPQDIGWEGMDRINLTQDRDKLLALVDKGSTKCTKFG